MAGYSNLRGPSLRGPLSRIYWTELITLCSRCSAFYILKLADGLTAFFYLFIYFFFFFYFYFFLKNRPAQAVIFLDILCEHIMTNVMTNVIWLAFLSVCLCCMWLFVRLFVYLSIDLDQSIYRYPAVYIYACLHECLCLHACLFCPIAIPNRSSASQPDRAKWVARISLVCTSYMTY